MSSSWARPSSSTKCFQTSAPVFLSIFVMTPTIKQINDEAWQPYQKGEITQSQALHRAERPIKTFMLKNTRKEELLTDKDDLAKIWILRKVLNELNTALLTRLTENGAIYLSNAVIDDRFALRACIVNFRTSVADVDAVPDIVVREGRLLHQAMAGVR